jgi:methionyl-tRNA synthetase
MFTKPRKKASKSTIRLLKSLRDRQTERDQGIYSNRDIMYVSDAFVPTDGNHNTVKSDDCANSCGSLDMAPDPDMEEPDEFLEFCEKIKGMVL